MYETWFKVIISFILKNNDVIIYDTPILQIMPTFMTFGNIKRAIPWWRLWPKFENFSLLIDHSSYNKQAINHFVVDVRSTLGGQSIATPQKLTSVKVKHSVHVTPGYVCDFARKWVLPLNRYKAQFLWSVIEFCVNIYIFDGRHIAKHFTILNMEIHFAPLILSILLQRNFW